MTEPGLTERERWQRALLEPGEGFFASAAGALGLGPRAMVREAVELLTGRVDWGGYLPHIPHGLLGLGAVLRLEPLLAARSFHRLVLTQLHALAFEVRAAPGQELAAIGPGSGNWDHVRLALDKRRPSLAWGELMALPAPGSGDFRRIAHWTAGDMANLGHKGVLACHLDALHAELGRPANAGRPLLALSAWLGASEPVDRFWQQRAAQRLAGWEGVLPDREAVLDPGEHALMVREFCDTGLVELLDRLAARIRAGVGTGDLLAALVLAASEKQLDARRDLEGKTSWTFVHLAATADRLAALAGPETWAQTAALVNLFPTDEPEDRILPKAPRGEAATLLDAILDGEPAEAMYLAEALFREQGPAAVLKELAEAASADDPVYNHSHQAMAVVAALDLVPRLPAHAIRALLVALAKSLANGQGSTDLTLLAERALSGTIR